MPVVGRAHGSAKERVWVWGGGSHGSASPLSRTGSLARRHGRCARPRTHKHRSGKGHDGDAHDGRGDVDEPVGCDGQHAERHELKQKPALGVPGQVRLERVQARRREPFQQVAPQRAGEQVAQRRAHRVEHAHERQTWPAVQRACQQVLARRWRARSQARAWQASASRTAARPPTRPCATTHHKDRARDGKRLLEQVRGAKEDEDVQREGVLVRCQDRGDRLKLFDGAWEPAAGARP